jgi:transcriptional regulator with XRE-family HTH domain
MDADRHLLARLEPRSLGARLREAREARGLTQQQLSDRMGIARTTIVAIEKGIRRLKPKELLAFARLLDRSVSELLQQRDSFNCFVDQLKESTQADAEILPPRYIALVFEAWQREQLSEGQLARLLRTDRLGAREKIQRIEAALRDGADQEEAP